MEVLGDNIANVSTIGFKSSDILFEDVLGSSMEALSGVNQTGVGVKVSSIDLNFTQGSMETTDVDTDVAIAGAGYFVVEDTTNNTEYYTRAGHFTVDSDGYLVTPDGFRVQGYSYDSTGTNLIESLTDIQLAQNNMTGAQQTTTAAMVLNLDATETAIAGGWLIANPTGTSNYSTPISVYDTLGTAHEVQVYFTKTGNQAWTWNAVLDGSDVSGGTAGTPVLYGTGSLAFNASGQLTTAPMPTTFRTAAITFANGLTAAATTIDFTGSTQYAGASTPESITQNGFSSGTISGVVISEDGTISGTYTNGTTQRIAQLVLANFVNQNGLIREGSQLYSATLDSGDALYNLPGAGGVGSVSSGMLEESNVDLAGELVKMMIFQRGYQANSKVISTVDEMMQTVIALK